ncbi:MAG: hypothetical protein M3R49_00205 [Chloroflexota bacterium]|nr:hypothetical protein [Chloroflexota bacterium]
MTESPVVGAWVLSSGYGRVYHRVAGYSVDESRWVRLSLACGKRVDPDGVWPVAWHDAQDARPMDKADWEPKDDRKCQRCSSSDRLAPFQFRADADQAAADLTEAERERRAQSGMLGWLNRTLGLLPAPLGTIVGVGLLILASAAIGAAISGILNLFEIHLGPLPSECLESKWAC